MKNKKKLKDILSYQKATTCIIGGATFDDYNSPIIPPIYQTSTFIQEAAGKFGKFDYARTQNPTRIQLEQAYAAVEHAKYAVAVCSGMAAELVILHSIPKGSRILTSLHLYGGSYRILTDIFKGTHQVNFVDFTDLHRVETALKKHKPKYLWIESPTNPILKVLDIKAIVSLAKKYNAKVIVDNTMATPSAQQPLRLGADLVFHSSTKYLNGHHDVIAGALMTNDSLWYERLDFVQNAIGTTPAPIECWLVLRGMKTLHVRMNQHEANAMRVAEFLERHKKIDVVYYPGLPSHPQHALAKKQMENFGGMLSFNVKGGQKKTSSFLEHLNLLNLAVSLGGIETLIEQPYVMTHRSMDKKLKASLEILPNTVRMSVGIEDADDIISDLAQALDKI